MKELKQKLLKNLEFAELYAKRDLGYEVSRMLVRARIVKGISQGELAKRLSTHQSSIARAERGLTLPSLSFLKKIADSYGTRLLPPQFEFLSSYGASNSNGGTDTQTITRSQERVAEVIRLTRGSANTPSIYA